MVFNTVEEIVKAPERSMMPSDTDVEIVFAYAQLAFYQAMFLGIGFDEPG